MISRRTFLQHSLSTTALISATPYLLNALDIKQKLSKFGFIAGIIGKELKADWRKALQQAASLGYKEFETGNHYGESARDFLAFCLDLGLKPVGGALKMTNNHDELNRNLDTLNELNLSYAIAYWPWFVSAPFKLEDCKKSTEAMNIMGEQCKKRGLTFCWHNHDKEFTPIEAGLPFDYVMNNTDQDLVKCEMDVYWIRKGNADPVELLKKYKGRYHALHIKDMTKDKSQTFACPGEGIINFKEIFREALGQNIKHFMVERDKIENGMNCLEVSSNFLRSIRF